MPANTSTITRHLPLITPRIEFFPSKHFGAPPVITPRIDFGATICCSNPHNNDWHTGDSEPENEAKFGSSNNNDPDDDADIVDKELTNTLISKPAGQPGRPRCGGYKLNDVLVGWSPQLIDLITVGSRLRID